MYALTTNSPSSELVHDQVHVTRSNRFEIIQYHGTIRATVAIL